VRSAGNSTYNYVNPSKRDVVSIGTSASDNTTIRFVTDNPGPWFMHCHIGAHSSLCSLWCFSELTIPQTGT